VVNMDVHRRGASKVRPKQRSTPSLVVQRLVLRVMGQSSNDPGSWKARSAVTLADDLALRHDILTTAVAGRSR
jgi:hypothetical protein